MKASVLVELLEQLCPREYACAWDNIGMHIGHYDKEIHKILVAVDADDSVVEFAVANNVDMIVTHHPLLFSGIKQINDACFMGRRVLKLIESQINCYCMHTNFDTVGGMATVSADRLSLTDCVVLSEVKDGEGIGRVGNLPQTLTIKELCNLVKKQFNLDCVVLYGDEKLKVSRVAICPGSGKDEIQAAIKLGAEVLITGDMTYHYGVDSVAQGLHIIDAGHYGIEHIFIEIITQYLEKSLENNSENNLNDIEIIPMKIDNPQKYI